MQTKKWENPEIVSLNSKETKNEPTTKDWPHMWHCLNCGRKLYTNNCKCDNPNVVYLGPCEPHPDGPQGS